MSNSRQSWISLLYIWGSQVIQLVQNYPSHWGQGYKSTTKRKELTPVDIATGEIQPLYSRPTSRVNNRLEVRGFIVAVRAKGSKSRLNAFSRAHSTTSSPENSLHSTMDEGKNLGFYRLARLWHYNYKKPNKIFDGNLKTLLNTKEL